MAPYGKLARRQNGTALPAFVFAGSWYSFAKLLLQELPRFVVASTLILSVSSAHSAGGSSRSPARSVSVLRWCRARIFYAAKTTFLLLLTFFISTDISLPLESRQIFVALPLQLLIFAFLALLALRWSCLEGERRCQHCLRALAAPARVGRPSWNFLEYNGTELAFCDGHGLLSVPEIQTCWCRSSAWIPQ